ncbi:restriction endonuclease [Solemya pervernicosa gill symbiont]|uniref:DNA (cytosine-5-)-methyltransferase n=1 Tax=Solemya pervernicosa gill symbiont TaxID=642797 RepID=A0A1T2L8B9_9GAMM|nr:DNA cytosine methyltransferase [Solemya pervernicosa gill symbiont]OOZ41321.1 restriction endonuclease [Solemya pervernicosa gill symbiont]
MKFISLFSGAMGLDLGLEMAGFETAVCVENDKEAVETIKHNRPDLPVFDTSIEEVTGKDLKKQGKFGRKRIVLVAGGPPCQAFSVFGNRLGIEDARGQLVFEFLRVIEETKPATFLMENVRGLLSMSITPNKQELLDDKKIPREYFEKGSLIKRIFEEFNKIGYNVDCFVVNSVNYGAPQIRERVLLIGNRFGYQAEFPEPEFSNRPKDNLPPFKTLGDAIDPKKGFIDSHPEVMNFSPRKLKYLAMVPEGGNWRSLPVDIQKESMKKSWYLKGGRSAYWRKLSFKFPSPTVVTMPNHAGTSMCHPKELRAISVGEAAAIQEFPPSWEFQGNTTAKFRQVGNAVPTRLGKVAGEVIARLIKQIEEHGRSKKPLCTHTITHLRPHVRTRTFWKDGESYSGDKCYYDKLNKADNTQLDPL